jgi:hypothetical protein
MATDTIAGDRIRALAGHGPPGIAVCVAGPEGVRAAGAAGLADIAASVQASPWMVCPWLSVTKLVTARVPLTQTSARLSWPPR